MIDTSKVQEIKNILQEQTSKDKKNRMYDEIMDEFAVALNVLAGNIDPDELTQETTEL